MTYFRQNIDAMVGYAPGEQPAAQAKVIKLNTNENPYPPSPAAVKLLGDLDGELLRRYPDPMAGAFCRAAAKALGVEPDWILAGNGSDDLLTMIFRACTGPARKAVVYPAPTYVLYRTLAEIQEARLVEVPYDEHFNLPADAILAADGAVTIVASPNSPSGTAVGADLLKSLAGGLNGLLVIDEAYVDFADGDALELAGACDNVIVLRTLSKGYSLAGLRLGFAVARPSLLAGLVKVKDSYNVDAIACAVAAAAIADGAHKIANAEKVKASRAKLTDQLAAMGFAVLPSQANFLLARPPAGDAQRIYQKLKEKGILVRYFNQPALEDKLRITVGTDGQNAALVRALKDLDGKDG